MIHRLAMENYTCRVPLCETSCRASLGKKADLRVYFIKILQRYIVNTLSKTQIAQLEICTHNDGPAFDLLGARFLTKAGGNSINKAFHVAEMLFPAGAEMPLHLQPEPEFFYVLAGACEFGTLENGSEQWSVAEPGHSILIPLGVPHGLRNVSGADARLLLVTTHRHEMFFQAVGTAADPAKPPRAATDGELEHVIRTAASYDTYAVTPEASFTGQTVAVTPTLKLVPRCYWRLEPQEKLHNFIL
jgi:quercetin dioxygenase-like cupin family protein